MADDDTGSFLDAVLGGDGADGHPVDTTVAGSGDGGLDDLDDQGIGPVTAQLHDEGQAEEETDPAAKAALWARALKVVGSSSATARRGAALNDDILVPVENQGQVGQGLAGQPETRATTHEYEELDMLGTAEPMNDEDNDNEGDDEQQQGLPPARMVSLEGDTEEDANNDDNDTDNDADNDADADADDDDADDDDTPRRTLKRRHSHASSVDKRHCLMNGRDGTGTSMTADAAGEAAGEPTASPATNGNLHRLSHGAKTTGAQKFLPREHERDGEGEHEDADGDEDGDEAVPTQASDAMDGVAMSTSGPISAGRVLLKRTMPADRSSHEEEEDEEEDEDDNEEEDDDEDEYGKTKETQLINGTTEVGIKSEERAKHEEQAGLIDFVLVENDNSRDAMIILTGAKIIFQKQLPKMPKEYITRLVYDRRHRTMAIVKPGLKVIGAITFRPFEAREFAEIVFCAVHSDNQVRGYGSLMMNHLKDKILAEGKIKYFLTYADNYAIGYFKKQGFTADITLDKSVWIGYIKDYDGATLLQVSLMPFNPEKCAMIPRIDYLRIHEMVNRQRDVLQAQIREVSQSHKVHPGLTMFKEKGMRPVSIMNIPGLREAGWTDEMSKSNRSSITNLQKTLNALLTAVKQNGHAWPFLKPVNPEEVTDYYDLIKNPMDLSTMERKVDNKQYPDMDNFVNDMMLIFNNCRTYNDESTPYYKCANTVERDFRALLKQLTKASPVDNSKAS